jgi:hypothetical protein
MNSAPKVLFNPLIQLSLITIAGDSVRNILGVIRCTLCRMVAEKLPDVNQSIQKFRLFSMLLSVAPELCPTSPIALMEIKQTANRPF